jgi:hypothetical protein
MVHLGAGVLQVFRTLDAILADPRIDHDTTATRPSQTDPASPATSENASVDVSRTAIE